MKGPAAGVFAALVLVGLAVYPRPVLLVKTLRHARRPDVDAGAVRALADSLPDDPGAVRDYVVRRLVPFAHDWPTYGVPYYFPTLAEALARGRGDCKGQALVIASLLAAKGTAWQLLFSPDHIWVEYEGKQPTASEDPAAAVAEFRDGRWHARRPSRLRLRANSRVWAQAYWDAAPRVARVLAAAGLAVLLVWAGRRRPTPGPYPLRRRAAAA